MIIKKYQLIALRIIVAQFGDYFSINGSHEFLFFFLKGDQERKTEKEREEEKKCKRGKDGGEEASINQSRFFYTSQ